MTPWAEGTAVPGERSPHLGAEHAGPGVLLGQVAVVVCRPHVRIWGTHGTLVSVVHTPQTAEPCTLRQRQVPGPHIT